MNANACDLGVSIRFRVSVGERDKKQQQRKGEIPNSTAECEMP